MIQEALNYIESKINEHFRLAYGTDEDIALLNSVVNPDGTLPAENRNKLVLSLIKMEEETMKPYYQQQRRTKTGEYLQEELTSRYNIGLLLTSNFDTYNESLKFIEAGLRYFKENAVFVKTVYADIPASIENLEVQEARLDYNQMETIWSTLGARYQLSVVYKLRVVGLQTEAKRVSEIDSVKVKE